MHVQELLTHASTCSSLHCAAMWECALLQEEGPTQEEVETLLTLEQRSYETQLQENSFWHEVATAILQSRGFQAVLPTFPSRHGGLAAAGCRGSSGTCKMSMCKNSRTMHSSPLLLSCKCIAQPANLLCVLGSVALPFPAISILFGLQ